MNALPATRFEYRFRFAIHAVLFALGFTAPWDLALHLDRFHTVWEWGATHVANAGWLSAGTAFIVLLVLAILLAGTGAFLRTWGAAYLGSGVVQSGGMHGSVIVADGPYRRLRNPLYLGTMLHTLALALLMPPSGALFAIVTTGLYQFRLIFAEEPFLAAKLGRPYLDYCARVPRIVPTLTPRVAASGAAPRWPQAMLGEIYMIGVVIGFAGFGWEYNALLLVRCVVISLGVSLVVRAAMPHKAES